MTHRHAEDAAGEGEPDELAGPAADDAVMAARWECADLLSRKSPEAARDLLLGHAAELAGSPRPRDRVLSKALEAGAADIAAGRRPLQQALPADASAETAEPRPGRRPRTARRWRILAWTCAVGLLLAGATSLALIDA
jgi:hypothetical protein